MITVEFALAGIAVFLIGVVTVITGILYGMYRQERRFLRDCVEVFGPGRTQEAKR
jgi:hypothetical protein